MTDDLVGVIREVGHTIAQQDIRHEHTAHRLRRYIVILAIADLLSFSAIPISTLAAVSASNSSQAAIAKTQVEIQNTHRVASDIDGIAHIAAGFFSTQSKDTPIIMALLQDICKHTPGCTNP